MGCVRSIRFAGWSFVAGLMALSVGVVAHANGATETGSGATTLQAIILEVNGRVRWRESERAAWHDAKMNDLLNAGAEIRTGLKSRAGLRIGKNATVLVDAGTTFQLPQIVQEGATLRTLAGVKSGRVDFKVDKVGFANDFKVITPQTTLSVRGTGFGVTSGSLTGSQVVGAQTNEINAIELKYLASNLQYFMSGGSKSDSNQKDPVHNAWLSTLGPPQLAGTVVSSEQLEQAAAQGVVGNAPTNPQQLQQQAAAQSNSQVTDQSPLAGLLRLESADADQARDHSSLTLVHAGDGDSAADDANESGMSRESDLNAALLIGASLETQWGTVLNPGDQATMTELSTSSDTDNNTMSDLHDDMNAAITVDNDVGVADALTAMGDIDDAWQEGLVAQVSDIVESIQGLQSDLSAALTVSEASDESYNALLDTATTKVNLAESTASSLSGLQASIQSYQSAVQSIVASGMGGAGAAAQLARSVEILNTAVARIAAAVSATDAAVAKLALARSMGERVLLSAVIAANARGLEIHGEAATIQTAILANVQAIEAARFGAFFAASAAAVIALEEESTTAADSFDPVAADAQAYRDQADVLGGVDGESGQIGVVVDLEANMNTFWTTVGQGGFSPKVRMEALQDQSDTDRAAAATMLSDLNDSIGLNDSSGAGLFLGDLVALNAVWNDPDEGLMVEVNGINGEVQGHLASVNAAFSTATNSRSDFNGFLSAATARRDIAQASASRMNFITSQMGAFQIRYTELVAQGRGGETAAVQLQNAITALDGVAGQVQAGIDASIAAADAVATATTYGQKVFFAAASDAHARAATTAAEAAGLQASIAANAAAIATDTATGQTNFDNAFGTGP